MNEFERRWKLGAAAARRAAGEASLEAPPGFATRIVARWQTAPHPSLASIWQQLAWRVLAGVAVALALLIVTDAATSPPADPLHADLGQTVSEMFWLQQP